MIMAGIIPLMPAMAVSVISARGTPWIRMTIAAITEASRNDSIGLALPVSVTEPTANPMTSRTGNTKFQNKLV